MHGSNRLRQVRMRSSSSTQGTSLQRMFSLWIGSFSDILILLGGCSGLHGVGTAAMSERGARWGVLDPDLRVKGTTRLRVVDASALPYVPTGHSELYIKHNGLRLTVVNSARTSVSARRGCRCEDQGRILMWRSESTAFQYPKGISQRLCYTGVLCMYFKVWVRLLHNT